MEERPRVLSGIQPTGVIHLGNYLGAIKTWVAEQARRENLFCLVNLHALTVKHDPEALRAKTREVAGLLLACGIDPNDASIFRQSDIPEHSELSWMLNCVASMGQLERMTQFKQKSGQDRSKASVGLFTYPLLMAADILLYQADEVPVGADQKQHVELTRDVAQRFNTRFGDTFRLPTPVIPTVGARIMSLTTPENKMSKSAPDGAIGLLDSPKDIRKRIKRAKTDSSGAISFASDSPGVRNLLGLYEALSGQSRDDIEARFEGEGYGALKGELAELVVAFLEPLQERYREIEGTKGYVDEVLDAGRQHVAPLAADTIARAKDRLGLS